MNYVDTVIGAEEDKWVVGLETQDWQRNGMTVDARIRGRKKSEK